MTNGEYGKWKFLPETDIGADDIRTTPIDFWHLFVRIHLFMTAKLFDDAANDSCSNSRVLSSNHHKSIAPDPDCSSCEAIVDHPAVKR
jgi:hypothetical protein